VVVTPSPFTTVYADDFAEERYRWNATSGQWALSGGTFAQASSTGDGRALVGVPTTDQAVEARVRQTAWSPTGTAERWAGVVARYKDASNYYYLHLRSGGTVSLRKLVNGAITELATAPLAVSLNTQYTLRLEAVGNQLRGFVNGNLLLQTTDSSLDAGIGGLMTSKASAQFDDYLAYQP
jgi:pectate lyase